jgi:hypothetical protein
MLGVGLLRHMLMMLLFLLLLMLLLFMLMLMLMLLLLLLLVLQVRVTKRRAGVTTPAVHASIVERRHVAGGEERARHPLAGRGAINGHFNGRRRAVCGRVALCSLKFRLDPAVINSGTCGEMALRNATKAANGGTSTSHRAPQHKHQHSHTHDALAEVVSEVARVLQLGCDDDVTSGDDVLRQHSLRSLRSHQLSQLLLEPQAQLRQHTRAELWGHLCTTLRV